MKYIFWNYFKLIIIDINDIIVLFYNCCYYCHLVFFREINCSEKIDNIHKKGLWRRW